MYEVNSNKVGLVVGGLFAILHAVWALMVLVNLAKPFMDWIFSLHFMSFQYSINQFSFGNALLLVIVTAVIGYIIGYVFGWLWNLAHKTAHNQ
ncbi:MAG: hypothetical protein ACYC5G_00580 [Candidatus Doudnabacteria bacterium]